MKKILLLHFFSVFIISSYAQISQDSLLIQVEDFILNGNSEIGEVVLSQIDTDENAYATLLVEIAQNKKISYKRYGQFLVGLRKRRPTLSYRLMSNFLDRKVSPPSHKEELNYHYVELIWTQISELSNLSLMNEALEKNNALQDYVDQYNSQDPDVRKAQILVDNHQSILHLIQREIEKGMELALKNEKTARTLNDTDLVIMSLYQQSDFFVAEQRVDEFIVVCEEGLRLDEIQKEKSNFYRSLISHLIDAYIYKGGKSERVKELITILEKDKLYKLEVLSYYGKFLGFANPKETDIQFILDRFDAENVLEVAHKAVKEAENSEDQNAFFHVIKEFAGALLNYDFKEAGRFYHRAISINQQIYSQELSKTLAENKTNQVQKEKEQAVAYEKEKTSLYALIALLVGVLFVISVFVFIRKRRQTKVLTENKIQLEKTLHEKQLLLKEVHHRVKNNFQIVSSLLELQSKGIEDEKARELASEGKNRVRSMALIHQKLYQNDDLVIYFNEYIRNLVKEIQEMYGTDKKTKVSIEVPNVAFDIDTAIPLGLIINELVTNSFKYGLEQQGELNISMQETNTIGTYELAVKDNGKGMPKEFNFSKAKSLGLRLVKSLTKQLHGKVNYVNKEGAIFTILFKNSNARATVE